MFLVHTLCVHEKCCTVICMLYILKRSTLFSVTMYITQKFSSFCYVLLSNKKELNFWVSSRKKGRCKDISSLLSTTSLEYNNASISRFLKNFQSLLWTRMNILLVKSKPTAYPLKVKAAAAVAAAAAAAAPNSGLLKVATIMWTFRLY